MLPIRREKEREKKKEDKIKILGWKSCVSKEGIHKICILVRAHSCQFMVWQLRRSYPSTMDELPAPLIKFEIPQEFHISEVSPFFPW